MKCVAISDVHMKFTEIKIPKCDLLISTGDYSFRGHESEVRDFHQWLNVQPARLKISVQGNHEVGVEKNFHFSKALAEYACPSVIFIDEGLVEFEGIRIWCSAITPFFRNWAWNRMPGEAIQHHWDKIPGNIDILATHGPAYGILDKLDENGSIPGAHVGCPQLLEKIKQIKPKIHVFGHIHNQYNKIKVNKTTFINASICNEQYKATNEPIQFTIHKTNKT